MMAAAIISFVRIVPNRARTAKISEPMFLFLNSSITHLVAGINPARPPKAQMNDCKFKKPRNGTKNPKLKDISEITKRAQLICLVESFTLLIYPLG